MGNQYWLITLRAERIMSGGDVSEQIYTYAVDKHPIESLAFNRNSEPQKTWTLLFAMPITKEQADALDA